MLRNFARFSARETSGTGVDISGVDHDEIQGDILIGLQKNAERFIFFEVKDTQGFKAALRQTIAPLITTTGDAVRNEDQLIDSKKTGRPIPDSTDFVGINIAFTREGLTLLTGEVAFGDDSFNHGALANAGAMGDEVDENKKPVHWKGEFTTSPQNIDGLVLVTAKSKDSVEHQASQLLTQIGPVINVCYAETGLVRAVPFRGHEHFGWKDGISQPGVQGAETPCKGQRLIEPGRFVFGYSPTTGPLEWMRNGSFMVFRRLNQFVPEFEDFISNTANALGMSPESFSAKLVGRWKGGAPITRSGKDDAEFGDDPQRNNDFDFTEDADQIRCPFAAHIRKTNPRADFDPTSPELSQRQSVDGRRIMRQGIPFGQEVTPAEQAARRTSADQERGLMFVCYQTSILDQFEFVQQSWANNSGFIMNKKRDQIAIEVGQDPIIGNSTQPDRARTIDWPTVPAPGLAIPREFVLATGGLYAFVPSLSALKGILSEQ